MDEQKPRPVALPSSKTARRSAAGEECATKATRKMETLRQAMLDAVSVEDIQEAMQRLAFEAKYGNIPAAKELLQRVLGPAEALDLVERIEALEDVAESILEDRG